MPETLGQRPLHSPDGAECKNIQHYGEYLRAQIETLRLIYARLLHAPNCVRSDSDFRTLHAIIDLLIAKKIDPTSVGVDLVKLAELQAAHQQELNRPHYENYLRLKAEGEAHQRHEQQQRDVSENI